MALLPPACGEMVVENPLSRVGHTHTHSAGARTPFVAYMCTVGMFRCGGSYIKLFNSEGSSVHT